MQHREPNPPREDPFALSEEDLLIAELAYSPAFRRFLEHIVAPRVAELRARLLRQPDLSEAERRGLVVHLLEVEKMVGAVYAVTEAGVPPAWVSALFR